MLSWSTFSTCDPHSDLANVGHAPVLCIVELGIVWGIGFRTKTYATTCSTTNTKAHAQAHTEAHIKAHTEAYTGAHAKAHNEAHIKAHTKAHAKAHTKANTKDNKATHIKAHSTAHIAAHTTANNSRNTTANTHRFSMVSGPYANAFTETNIMAHTGAYDVVGANITSSIFLTHRSTASRIKDSLCS